MRRAKGGFKYITTLYTFFCFYKELYKSYTLFIHLQISSTHNSNFRLNLTCHCVLNSRTFRFKIKFQSIITRLKLLISKSKLENWMRFDNLNILRNELLCEDICTLNSQNFHIMCRFLYSYFSTISISIYFNVMLPK